MYAVHSTKVAVAMLLLRLMSASFPVVVVHELHEAWFPAKSSVDTFYKLQLRIYLRVSLCSPIANLLTSALSNRMCRRFAVRMYCKATPHSKCSIMS